MEKNWHFAYLYHAFVKLSSASPIHLLEVLRHNWVVERSRLQRPCYAIDLKDIKENKIMV